MTRTCKSSVSKTAHRLHLKSLLLMGQHFAYQQTSRGLLIQKEVIHCKQVEKRLQMFEAVCSFLCRGNPKGFSICQATAQSQGQATSQYSNRLSVLLSVLLKMMEKVSSTEDKAREERPKMPVNKYRIESSELSERLAINPKG